MHFRPAAAHQTRQADNLTISARLPGPTAASARSCKVEIGDQALAVMRSLKASPDPRGILNRGKRFLD